MVASTLKQVKRKLFGEGLLLKYRHMWLMAGEGSLIIRPLRNRLIALHLGVDGINRSGLLFAIDEECGGNVGLNIMLDRRFRFLVETIDLTQQKKETIRVWGFTNRDGEGWFGELMDRCTCSEYGLTFYQHS